MSIAVIGGDGIGPETMARMLEILNPPGTFEFSPATAGGGAINMLGTGFDVPLGFPDAQCGPTTPDEGRALEATLEATFKGGVRPPDLRGNSVAQEVADAPMRAFA